MEKLIFLFSNHYGQCETIPAINTILRVVRNCYYNEYESKDDF